MKTIILILFTVAVSGVAFARTDCLTTLCLRWQQPAAHETNAAPVTVGVTEKELHKAIRLLTKTLRKSGVAVHYGYFAATEPSTDRRALGRLWIDRMPLDMLLASGSAAAGATAEQIVQAGWAASDKLLAAADARAQRKHSSGAGTITVAPASTRGLLRAK